MLTTRYRIDRAIAEITDEYLQPHAHPWIVAYSGGKDSTLVLHLVVEAILRLAPSDRRRDVHVVCNDTLVESPVLIAHARASLEKVGRAAESLRLPLQVHVTAPSPDQTFWCNLIGRGYPPPNRRFRWCTDRMKIGPTTRFVREHVSAAGQVVLLVGVRRSESANPSWRDLPASSSMWTRVICTRRGPFGPANSTTPSLASGCSYWEIW